MGNETMNVETSARFMLDLGHRVEFVNSDIPHIAVIAARDIVNDTGKEVVIYDRFTRTLGVVKPDGTCTLI